MFVRRPTKPARKLSFSSRVGVARGLLRAARSAAERDKCAVAELLLAYATPDLQGATKQVHGRVRSAIKVLDAGQEAADTINALLDCQARARAKVKGTSELLPSVDH